MHTNRIHTLTGAERVGGGGRQAAAAVAAGLLQRTGFGVLC